ncbi:MAG: PEP-CTERM sorting domain-containing protein [Geitlerinemataceae cyanobacterium]
MFKITQVSTALGSAIALAGALSALPAHAVSLDWESLAQQGQWTDGQTSGSFLLDSASGLSVDIDILIGEDTSLNSFGGGNLTPSVNSIVNGTQGDDDRSLHIQIDPDRAGTPGDSSFMTFAADFSQAVSGLSFSIFDIDLSNIGTWQDRVVVKGYKDGELVTPTFAALASAASFAVTDAFTLDGTGVGRNDSNDGAVKISFAGMVDSIEIAYGSGPDIAVANPETHGIGIGDFTMTAPETLEVEDVPEPATTAGLLGLSIAALVGRRKRD